MSPILVALKYETHVVFASCISAFPIAFGIFFLKNHVSNVIVFSSISVSSPHTLPPKPQFGGMVSQNCFLGESSKTLFFLLVCIDLRYIVTIIPLNFILVPSFLTNGKLPTLQYYPSASPFKLPFSLSLSPNIFFFFCIMDSLAFLKHCLIFKE